MCPSKQREGRGTDCTMLTQEGRSAEGIEWRNLKDNIATRITFYKWVIAYWDWQAQVRCWGAMVSSGHVPVVSLVGCFLFLWPSQAFYWKCWGLTIFSFPSNTFSCQFSQLIIILANCYLSLNIFLCLPPLLQYAFFLLPLSLVIFVFYFISSSKTGSLICFSS